MLFAILRRLGTAMTVENTEIGEQDVGLLVVIGVKIASGYISSVSLESNLVAVLHVLAVALG